MWRSLRRIWLPLLAICFSALWAWRVPIGDSDFANYFPDEGNHIAVVRYLAGHLSPPPYSLAYYESAHPPLYHAGAAGLYRLAEPWLGARGAVGALRFAGALLGGLLTFLVGEGVARVASPRVAVLAAGLAGLLPGRIAVSAGVGNENLAALAGVGALAALAALLRSPASRRALAALALWTALAVGAKVTGLGLVVAVLIGLRRGRTRATVLGAILLLDGPWMVYNALRYGDPYLVTQTEAVWGRLIPGLDDWLVRGGRSFGYVKNVAFRGWESFLGAFDGLGRAFFPTVAYLGALVVPLAALSRKLRLRRAPRRRLALGGAALFGVSLLVFVLYNYRHFAPQGRFLFVALLPLAWWGAEGWLAVWPVRFRNLAVALPLIFLFGLNVYALAFLAPK